MPPLTAADGRVRVLETVLSGGEPCVLQSENDKCVNRLGAFVPDSVYKHTKHHNNCTGLLWK